MNNKVFVFVDNSNLWIEGKKISGQHQKPKIPSNGLYRVEYGKLLSHITEGRDLGAVPKLYGSEPPPNDSVWKMIESKGFDVSVFKRNIFGKEKGVDMRLGLDIGKLVLSPEEKATIVLVAGDADFVPVVDDVHEAGWKIEIWYWAKAAYALQQAVDRFEALDASINNIGYEKH